MSLRRVIPVLLMLIASAALNACDSKESEFFEPISESGAGLFSDEATGGVSGLVTVDGLPLAAVRIALGHPANRGVTTDGEGRFLFEALEPGSYPVELTDLPAGVACPEIAASVLVVAGDVTSVDFGCAAIGGVQGIVILNGGGYEGVHVTVAGPDTLQIVTGPDGSFDLADLPVGSYTVSLESLPSEVVCPEYSLDRTVERAGIASATFDCTDLGGVSGTVILDGAPYAGVQVSLSGGVSADTSADPVGEFEFADVRAGSYTVSLPGLPANVTCTDTTIPVVVVADQTTSANFDCVAATPPSFDDILGFYDIEYVPTLTTCEASIGGFSVVAEMKPYTADPPGVDFNLPNTMAPIWGYYYESSGEFVGDFMWHDDVPGDETNEFWVATFFMNAHGSVAFTGTAIEIFRDVTSQVEVCRREYDVSGTKQP